MLRAFLLSYFFQNWRRKDFGRSTRLASCFVAEERSGRTVMTRRVHFQFFSWFKMFSPHWRRKRRPAAGFPHWRRKAGDLTHGVVE